MQTRQGLIAGLPTGSKSRSGMTVSPLDLRNSAGRSRRNNDSPTPRSPSIPPGNVYKPDRALATQFTISKSNDQPARRALVLGPLDSRSPFEGVLPGTPSRSLAAGGSGSLTRVPMMRRWVMTMSEGREMPARVTDDCPQMTQMNRAAAGCSVCNHKATINGFSARVAIAFPSSWREAPTRAL